MPSRRLLFVAAGLLLALSAWALAAGSTIPPDLGGLRADAAHSDESLYETVADRVRGGESYYRAAVSEQQSAGYPTSRVVTIRMPTTSWLLAAAGEAAPWVLRALIMAAAAAAMFRLESVAPSRAEWIAGSLLVAAAIGVFAHPRAVVLAEAWTACLLVLSLAVYRPGRYRCAVALGLGAVLFRELAAPYLVVMALLAWRRDRREAVMWLAATAAFVTAYAVHAWAAVRSASGVESAASASWLTFGGWPYVVDTFGFSSVLRPLPYEVWVVALALAMLGWAGLANRYSRRVLAVTAVFLVIFCVAGRPDTAYWGRLYVAWLLPGLAFAPRALATLVAGARLPRDSAAATAS